MQRNGKFVTAMRPLFPGYIFVAFDVTRGFWRTINSTYGITRLVSLGKEPTAVPLDLVSQLMLRCDAKGKLLPPKLLKPGDQVMLTKGPFANFVAEVETIAPDRRVWVLMEIMGWTDAGCGWSGSAAGGVSKFAVVVGLLQMLLLSAETKDAKKRTFCWHYLDCHRSTLTCTPVVRT